jgi:hypothetical protein
VLDFMQQNLTAATLRLTIRLKQLFPAPKHDAGCAAALLEFISPSETRGNLAFAVQCSLRLGYHALSAHIGYSMG